MKDIYDSIYEKFAAIAQQVENPSLAEEERNRLLAYQSILLETAPRSSTSSYRKFTERCLELTLQEST